MHPTAFRSLGPRPWRIANFSPRAGRLMAAMGRTQARCNAPISMRARECASIAPPGVTGYIPS